MTHKFHTYVSSGGDHQVGGAVINCLCSEFGHCYVDQAGAHAWDITLTFGNSPEVEIERARLRKTGMNDYVYNLCAPAERGIGIVGFFLDQPGIGWIHDPIVRDDPIRIDAHSVPSFSEALKMYIGSRALPNCRLLPT